jgi:S-methylmethionine-dependent homocysteine/selenocysteine methylase
MLALPLSDGPLLLDGGMGRELRFRGIDTSKAIWSAKALIMAPNVVREVHQDYITAGADVITTNTYGVIRRSLVEVGIEDRFAELNTLACTLAREACQAASRPVWVAGSLPPLRTSYRPDLVGDFDEIVPLYQEQVELLAPHVDLFLCETMSSAAEGRAAAWAATQSGLPVWVSWTLHEDCSGRLRSGESLVTALNVISDLPISGFHANCSSPESITQAIPELVATGVRWVGGYANTFAPVPQDWSMSGEKPSDGLLGLRSDLDPFAYADHVAEWLQMGATVVGGCCGTRPAHIAQLHTLLRHFRQKGGLKTV